MGLEFTDAQKDAINADGSVLVTAAAGSGKTAVLVERVIKMLTNSKKQISADNLLIVTFTKDAAAELKFRISERINKECIENPKSNFLKMQKAKIKEAKICTIDAFCIDLVHQNFQLLSISPNIQIASDEISASVKENVFSALVEKYFAQNFASFSALVQCVGAGSGVNGFKDNVFTLYSKSRTMPNPDKWLKDAKKLYSAEFEESVWYKRLFEYSLEVTNTLIEKLSQALIDLEQDEFLLEKCSPFFINAQNLLIDLKEKLENKDWDKVLDALQKFEFTAFGNFIRASKNKSFKRVLSAYRNYTISSVGEMLSLFEHKFKSAKAINKRNADLVNLLIDFTIEFGSIFENELISKNKMTFNMAEHFALKLLCRTENDGIVLTDLAKQLTNVYKEVLVDEFQDVNDLQDTLFYALSNKGENLFSVGDVKQSIYGFRYANPDNFLRKKETFTSFDGENYPAKIVLDANFRSRNEICEFINFIFRKIMSKDAAKIEYNREETLIPEAKFPENGEIKNDVIILSNTTEDSNTDFEVKATAEYIKNTVGKKILRKDENTLREVEYDDFAILLRSGNSDGEKYISVFKEYGIPFSFSSNNFEDSSEIQSVIAIIRAVNNPRNDVALFSMLTGPIFNFSVEEIAEIRTESKKTALISSVTKAANGSNQKFKNFLNVFKSIKRLSISLTVSEFIMYLYKKYFITEIFSAVADGEERRANLLKLVELASNFDNEYVGGLVAFLRYFDNLSASDGFKNISSPTDSKGVKIMTIHSSKGLQFPICILGFSNKSFSNETAKSSISIGEKYGIGLRISSAKEKIKTNSIAKKIIDLEIKNKEFAEEMRLLYVALTRAEEKLAIFASYPKLEDSMVELACNAGTDLNKTFLKTSAISNCNSYADWIISALLFHRDCSSVFKDNFEIDQVIDTNEQSFSPVNLIFESEVKELAKKQEEKLEKQQVNSANIEKIKDNLSWEYSFSKSLDLKAKMSVTEMLADEQGDKFDYISRPDCLYSKGLTPAEKGTIVHKILELIDFSVAKKNLNAELERLVEWEYLSEDEVQNINIENIEKFLNSPLCERILSSKNYIREQNFITKLKNSDADGIIIQGCADLIFEQGDGLVIVDFKTSIMNTEQEFIKAYKEQLDVYAAALEEIFAKPVKEKIIYSLFLEKEIKV